MRDPEGRIWAVRELVHLEDGSEQRSLIFDDGEVVRRVRDFPSIWHLLPEEELIRISRRR